MGRILGRKLKAAFSHSAISLLMEVMAVVANLPDNSL